MPKTAMYEYDRPEPGQNEIRPAGQTGGVQSVPKACSMQDAAELKFGPGVL